MVDPALEAKFDELFDLFEKVVSEMGGQSKRRWSFKNDVRQVGFTLVGREFTFAAQKVGAPAQKSKTASGIQARASLQREDRRLAEFLLHASARSWKFVRDTLPLSLADVDAETIRAILRAALEEST